MNIILKFNFKTNAVVLKFVLNIVFFMYCYIYLFQICSCMFLKNTMTALIFRLAHEILNAFFHWHLFINIYIYI